MNTKKRNKLFIGVPTLFRSDLLHSHYGDFTRHLKPRDTLFILNNGKHNIDSASFGGALIERSPFNLGVAGSWNHLARTGFSMGFDAVVLLQDDVRWETQQLQCARRLLRNRHDIGHFLSFHDWSVQILRLATYENVGPYDERFFPAFYEDDDYARRLTLANVIYERFRGLDPSPGSIRRGTSAKIGDIKASRQVFLHKWGAAPSIPINSKKNPLFRTNKGAVSPLF